MRVKLIVPLGQVQERWQTDRRLFVEKVRSLGVNVMFQASNQASDSLDPAALQAVTKFADVLVILSSLTGTSAPLVEFARKEGIRVIAYDRLIRDCALDLFVSFDNVKVGELQAGFLVKRKPRGNYVIIGGPAADNNSVFYRQGQMNILQPYITRGDIKIVAEQEAKDWLPSEAHAILKKALDGAGNQVDAVLATNDNLAQGAIHALSERGLAGKVLVTGMDAEMGACKRMTAGTQSMTVYKPVHLLAHVAAEMAVALGNKDPLPTDTKRVHNGKMEVPSILLEPLLVDVNNMKSTVIADGFQSEGDIDR